MKSHVLQVVAGVIGIHSCDYSKNPGHKRMKEEEEECKAMHRSM
jgi:hypothetical protein